MIVPKFLPKAKKSLGQHFLKDETTLQHILDAADITSEDVVVEVGPGRGALTNALVAASPKKLIIIEKDKDLIHLLKEKFGSVSFIEIIQADVLTLNISELAGGPFKLIANIPYYISTPLLKKILLREASLPERMVLLVQKEFGQKLVALPPDVTYTSILTQLCMKGTMVATVRPEAFTPPPKVTSAVMLFDKVELHKNFRQIASFAQRCFLNSRKKIRNGIDKKIQPTDNASDEKYLELLEKRPENLFPEEWISLFEYVYGTGK